MVDHSCRNSPRVAVVEGFWQGAGQSRESGSHPQGRQNDVGAKARNIQSKCLNGVAKLPQNENRKDPETS